MALLPQCNCNEEIVKKGSISRSNNSFLAQPQCFVLIVVCCLQKVSTTTSSEIPSKKVKATVKIVMCFIREKIIIRHTFQILTMSR